MTDSAYLAREIEDNTKRAKRIAAVELRPPEHPRIFAVSNQKGGVGKTTSAVNIAAALAIKGLRVLVIDLDPQGNASTALGIEHHGDVPGTYEALIDGVPMVDLVKPSSKIDGLWGLPATINLAGAEIEMVAMDAREALLNKSIEQYLATTETPPHFIFIDSPPSLGLLTINAFVAATEVLLPIQCEYYALEGLSQLIGNIELIRKRLNPSLDLSTILLTMHDSRTRLSTQVVEEVRTHFPGQALQAVIPRSVRISEAPSYAQTIISYDPMNAGSLAYQEAAIEISNQNYQGVNNG